MLPQIYLQHFQNAPNIWIAYSGGLDSCVLLQLMAELAQQEKIGRLHAIHINHGWHVDAKKWAKECQQICRSLKIPCQVITVNAKPKRGESAEACARDARYTAFASQIKKNDLLLTAHHQDDQAETLLLQLFRGAGVKGLASMPALMPFAKGLHLRPLLNFTRDALEEYAAQNNLYWIDDDSNQDLRFDRNFIRHQLMPTIQQRWPQITHTLHRVAENCAQADILLKQLAQEDLQKVQGTQPETLSIKKLLALGEARWQNVFRHWLHQLNLSLPSQAQLQQVARDVLKSKTDANPKISWSNVIIRRYRDNIYALASTSSQPLKTNIAWDLSKPLVLPGIGTLVAELKIGEGINQNKIASHKINVKFRSQGERCHPTSRTGSHPLKKLFQEWHVPTWLRDHIPLIYYQDDLAAIVGFTVCKPYATKKNEFGWVISLKKKDKLKNPVL